MIPRVAAEVFQERSLAYPVEIQGRIEAKKVSPTYCTENLRVGELLVEINDIVTKGEVLFSIDTDDLAKKIEDAKWAMKKLILQIEDLKSNYEIRRETRSKNIRWAREDYTDTTNSVHSMIDAAYQDMENARMELEDYISNSSVEAKDLEQLNQDFIQQKRLYEEAVFSGQEALKNALRQMEDAETEIIEDSSIAILEMDLEVLEESYEELVTMKESGGKVHSDIDGRISGVYISVGDIVGMEPVIVMEDFRQGFRFEGMFDAQLSSLVKEGQQCQLELLKEDKIFENQKISKVFRDEEGVYNVFADLASYESDGWDKPGNSGEAVLKFTKSGKLHRNCIPLSALFQDTDGYYVLAITESVTILGLQTTAAKVKVDVEEQDGGYAAVKGDFVGYGGIIINASKTIKDGDRIRIVEEK